MQTDNGAIFKSGDFLDALLRLETGTVPTPNDCPSANGKIERFFKTVEDQLFRQLSSYAQQHRGLAAAKANPLPWPKMQSLVDRFLSGYHLRRHSSLGKSPWEAWHNGLISAHGLSLDVGQVIEACKIRVEKTVNREGIEHSPGRHLSAPELAGLVGEKVTLRLLPEGGELAEAIKVARLDRARELGRLRKSLLKTASRMLGSTPAQLPPGEPIKLDPFGTEDSAKDDEPFDVPDLQNSEDEEA